MIAGFPRVSRKSKIAHQTRCSCQAAGDEQQDGQDLAEEGQGAAACGEASAQEIGGKTRRVGLSDDQSAEGRSLSRSKRPLEGKNREPWHRPERYNATVSRVGGLTFLSRRSRS